MLFYSLSYLSFFLPISLILFFYAKFIKIDTKIIIILLSIFFYSWWNIYYLPVILFSIFFNFILSKKIISTRNNKKSFLILGIFLNVLLLIIFKYLDFIIENFNLLFSAQVELINLPFPLAISFFTFQSITFLVNVYDEEIFDVKAKDFFLFIIFFPQLIAGPIVRYKHMIPQFNNEANLFFNKKNFTIGFVILFIGFIKKVYFADTLSQYVDLGYNEIQNLNFFSSWFLSLCFTFQFYFDFSGYVDMATGSAIMMNIVLPQNFNSPLKATSVIDFWQRWHMTLTQFLTNHIYYPLLRSLKNINFYNSMLATMIVFLIAGFWHGPSWNFLIFGLFHGVGIVINHSYKKFFKYRLPKYLSWFLTINYINISFIFFRSEEVSNAFIIIKKMFDINFLLNINYILSIEYYLLIFSKNINLLICFLISAIIIFYFKNSYELLKESKNLKKS